MKVLLRLCDQLRTSLLQAAAKSRKVAQEIMVQAELNARVLWRYFHFRSGMGFRMMTCPASRLLSCRAFRARFWPVVLVSERISSVAALP